MRVSAGMAVIALCGKTRIYRRPSPRMKWLAVTRPASIDSALSHPPSRDCKPNSPNATKLPRMALPFSLPRWFLRNFTLLGICGMACSYLNNTFIRSRRLKPAATAIITNRQSTFATWAATFSHHLRLGCAGGHGRIAFVVKEIAVIDPHLDADVALRRLGFGEAVIDLRAQGRQRDAAF